MNGIEISRDFTNNFTEIMEQKKFIRHYETSLAVPLFVTGYTMLIVSCLLGNILELFILPRIKQPDDYIHYALCTLACSDLIQGVFKMPTDFITGIYLDWFLGVYLCKISKYVEYVNTLIGIWITVYIAFDRYINICYPLKFPYFKTKKFCIIVLSNICFGHLVVFIFIYHSFGIKLNQIDKYFYEKCYIILSDLQLIIFRIIINMIYMFLLPLTILIFFYGSILHNLFKFLSFKTLLSSNCSKEEETLPATSTINLVIVKVLLFLIIFFFFLNLPLFVCKSFTLVFLNQELPMEIILLDEVGSYIQTMHSSLNPWIYSFYSNDFRKEFTNTFFYNRKKRSTMRLTLLGSASNQLYKIYDSTSDIE